MESLLDRLNIFIYALSAVIFLIVIPHIHRNTIEDKLDRIIKLLEEKDDQ